MPPDTSDLMPALREFVEQTLSTCEAIPDDFNDREGLETFRTKLNELGDTLKALRTQVFARIYRLEKDSCEAHLCASRQDNSKGTPDFWRVMPNGDRTCSYCGSMHPVDFLEFVKKVGVEKDHYIDDSDKRYKFYVRRPSVGNAAEGAIKFYGWHAGEHIDELNRLLPAAVGFSRKSWK